MAYLRFLSFFFVAACLVILPGNRASAISAVVAKKCNALTAKAFPPRMPGNPAAGSAKGTGKQQLAYFKNCVARGGKADDSAVTKTK